MSEAEEKGLEDSESSSYTSCSDEDAQMQIELIPRIPWYQANESNPAMMFEESKYFKDVMEGGSSEKGRLNLVLYKIINECFPYYLPKFVHCMDFSELREQAGVVDKIGRAATHFVITNSAHGPQLFSDLSKAISEKTEPESLQRLLTYLQAMRQYLLQPGFETGTDPADFLLEPWVLIQLPFHPAVVHQWLVALSAEYQSFRKQTAFLRFLNLPREMAPLVKLLFALGLVLLDTLTQMLGFLECWTKTKNPGLTLVFDTCIHYCCSPYFAKTIAFLQFLLSGKCSDLIKSLKKQAWNSSTWNSCRQPFDFLPKVEDMNILITHVYSYKFWMASNMGEIFGKREIRKKKKAERGKKKENKEPLLPFEEPKFDLKVDLVVLGQFIEDHILAPGWLKGISKEKLLLLVEKSCCQKKLLLRAYHRFTWFKAAIGTSNPSPPDMQLLSKAASLDGGWVLRWLDDVGLPQHKDAFLAARIDGAVLHRLTTEDLVALHISSCLQAASVKRGIQVLRENEFNPSCLIRRSNPEDQNPPSFQEVALWTNHRVMEWLRAVDLAEYAPNMRGSGVHGALMVHEPKFTAELLASLLAIPPNKTLLRRHLSTHFQELVGQDKISEKRQAEDSSGFATTKLKPSKKSQFTLKKKKVRAEMELDDLVCPLKSESIDQVRRFKSRTNKLTSCAPQAQFA